MSNHTADSPLDFPGLAGVDPRWAEKLERFGERIALVPEHGHPLSYRELCARADAFRAQLGDAPRLVALLVRNDVESVAAYLGCLRGHRPVLLLAAGEPPQRIIETFAPDALFDAETGALSLTAPQGGLHPDLAVLLSTSGSTGSPKLVRLSRTNIAANAQSIRTYLAIDENERAITTLPSHYSYGLSVLNSHLMAGASLVLTDLSVTHADFLALTERTRPTSLAGVPYSHELLLRSGVVHHLPTSVKTLTQAGGRLAPEKIVEMGRIGAERGFRFVPMYGQTEATARMAFLDPALAQLYPDCIGRPIPGGHFERIDGDGRPITQPGVAGELVYTGPNVMMGYGFARADLERGPELASLHTGDIAEETAEGLYRIVGRASRFAKIAGLRIGFDDVEALLRARGFDDVVATGSDELLVVQVRKEAEPKQVAALLAASLHLPEAVIAVVAGAIPRLANGKVDYRTIRAAGEEVAQSRERALAGGIHPILAGFRRAFSDPDLDPRGSFQSLGGDSLAYVNVAIAIEKALGELPTRWEEIPIRDLIALGDMRGTVAKKRGGFTDVSTETLIRVFALALVITGHGAPDDTLFLRGGATVLMMLAGYNFARFQRSAFERGEMWPALKGSLERLILPYYLIMIPMLYLSKADRSWGWFALVSSFTVQYHGPLFSFWFIEAVFQALLLVILFYSIAPIRRLSVARPTTTAFLLLGLALLLSYVVPTYFFDSFDGEMRRTIDGQFWLYALGIVVLGARGNALKIGLVVASFWLCYYEYGSASSRPYWFAALMLLLMYRSTIPVPARLAGPVLRIAAASYFIYVIHVLMNHVVHFMLKVPQPWFSIALMLVLSTIGGVLFEIVWVRGMMFAKGTLHDARGRLFPRKEAS